MSTLERSVEKLHTGEWVGESALCVCVCVGGGGGGGLNQVYSRKSIHNKTDLKLACFKMKCYKLHLYKLENFEIKFTFGITEHVKSLQVFRKKKKKKLARGARDSILSDFVQSCILIDAEKYSKNVLTPPKSLQWLKHLWDHGNMIEIRVVRASESQSWHRLRKQMAII